MVHMSSMTISSKISPLHPTIPATGLTSSRPRGRNISCKSRNTTTATPSSICLPTLRSGLLSLYLRTAIYCKSSLTRLPNTNLIFIVLLTTRCQNGSIPTTASTASHNGPGETPRIHSPRRLYHIRGMFQFRTTSPTLSCLK